MNKSFAWVCSLIATAGMLILALSFYYALTYGHGDYEAGNFNHCHYWTESDARTGQCHRHWERSMVQFRSGVGSFVAKMDMWILGGVLMASGAGLWVGDWSGRREHRTD